MSARKLYQQIEYDKNVKPGDIPGLNIVIENN
jgi:hypothetical protein